jgi:hypothetical protein
VRFADFAKAESRARWIEEKGMVVLSLWSPNLPATELDLFASEPFPFEAAYARALRADLGSVIATVAGLEDLIALKRSAGRPQDLDDVRALEALASDAGERDV